MFLNGADRKDRIRKAIFAVCDELERLGHSIDTQANATWFKKGAETLVAEAARSADEHKALQLGIAFARGWQPSRVVTNELLSQVEFSALQKGKQGFKGKR
jgi:hypothetical protein